MAVIVDIHSRQKVIIELLTVEGSTLIEFHHRCLRSVYAEVAIYVNLNTESVILRAVERSLVTGPARADQPQQ
jgi:hypothetical protein